MGCLNGLGTVERWKTPTGSALGESLTRQETASRHDDGSYSSNQNMEYSRWRALFLSLMIYTYLLFDLNHIMLIIEPIMGTIVIIIVDSPPLGSVFVGGCALQDGERKAAQSIRCL